MKPRVVVSGCAGWLGRALVATLRARGCAVVGLDCIAPESAPPCDRFAYLNLLEGPDAGAPWWDELRGADAFIHCAGYAHRPVETAAEVERFFAINRDGTARVVRACEQQGVPKLLYISTIAFYGARQEKAAVEDAPLDPRTAYARSKLDGEIAVKESALDWRAVRLATLFGTGDKANFARLASALSRGRFVLPGDATARKSVMPADLAAELIAEFALQDQPRHRLINLGLPRIPTLQEVVAAFVNVCGFPQPRRLPISLLRTLAAVGDIAALVRPGFPLTSGNVRKLTQSSAVEVRRMTEVFPGRTWPDFATALARHADWYRRPTSA